MWTEATAPLMSARIHYIVSPNTGSAVVFVHGLGDSLESYLPVLPALIPSYQVFALTLRGHEASSHHPGHYHIYDHAADL